MRFQRFLCKKAEKGKKSKKIVQNLPKTFFKFVPTTLVEGFLGLFIPFLGAFSFFRGFDRIRCET